MTNEISLPVQKLAEIGKQFPALNRSVNSMLQGKGKDLPGWPEYVFLPMAAWLAIVTGGDARRLLAFPPHANPIAEMAALGTWRYSQGIYKFDTSLVEALSCTPLDSLLPVEILKRLPEFCVFIESDGLKLETQPDVAGFFAHLEYDVQTHKEELRFELLWEDGSMHPVIVALQEGASVLECVQHVYEEENAKIRSLGRPELCSSVIYSEAFVRDVQKLIALVLYLCSDKPEIDNLRQPGTSPSRPKPKKVQGGLALFPAQRPTAWEVGKRIGQSLRTTAQSRPSLGGSHASPRAHVRRGHWHGYWTGPRKGQRTFILKWLHPMLVNMDMEAE